MANARTIKLWSRIHVWTSLICMVFMLMLCVTGLPLIFHDEIDDWLEEWVAAPPMPTDTPKASLDQVITAAKQRYPGEIVLFAGLNEHNPDVVTIGLSSAVVPQAGQIHRVAVDFRTAAILGEPARDGQNIMDIILTLHKDMFTGLPGELFLGAMGVVFALSIISGVVIYAPFMRRITFGTVRRKASARLKWLDTHNLLGVVTVTWALVVGLTGTVNTLSVPLFDLWRAQVLPGLLAPHQGQPVAQPGSVDAAVRSVRQALPGVVVTSVTMPTLARFGSPRHFVVWTKGDKPFTARLFTPVLVDAVGGVVVVAPDMPWYLRLLQISRPLHFGDYGGLPLKIIWALLDLATIIVLWSGLYLWWKKYRPAPAVMTAVTLEAKSAS